MPLPDLVLALAVALGRGTPATDIAQAIAAGCEAEARHAPVDVDMCAALVTTYMAHESGFQDAPSPVSWDARARVSCGVLQVPCRWSRGPRYDVRLWLWMLRRSTLGSVDSSPLRAAARLVEARAALDMVRAGR